MASAQAYEQPTINRAWEDFIAHISTILLIWVAFIALSLLGGLAYFVFSLVGGVTGSGLSGGSIDASTLFAMLFGYLGQLPFVIISSLISVLFVAVPAMYYNSGEIVTINASLNTLLQRPLRYLLAGILFSVATSIGFLLCVLPGIAIALIMPVYVNRIFASDQTIFEAFSGSFQAVYNSPKGLDFVGIQILAGLLTAIVSICTCGLGAFIALPVCTFYIQNAAYNKGIIR